MSDGREEREDRVKMAARRINMESMQPFTTSAPGYDRHTVKWAPAEKQIARRMFDKAYQREIDAITEGVKERAQKIHDSRDLWKLHDFLSKKRKETDQKYDYRYSMLAIVFGRLIREGLLSIDELRGLSEEKLAHIRQIASFKFE
jgi:hypothetical protein